MINPLDPSGSLDVFKKRAEAAKREHEKFVSSVEAQVRSLRETFDPEFRARRLLREKGATELIEIMDDLPASEISKLVNNFPQLEKHLISKKQKRDKALCKLGDLQKEILLKIHYETKGDKSVEWFPVRKLPSKRTSSAESAASVKSKVLTKLEKRGLITSLPRQRDKSDERTHVRLTNLGDLAIKWLTKKTTG